MANCLYCHKVMPFVLNMHTAFQKPNVLCEHCQMAFEQLLFNEEGRCSYCKGRLYNGSCPNCAKYPEYVGLFHSITAIFHYESKVRDMIHQFKFLKDVALAEVLAQYMTLSIREYDAIIPIPSVAQNDIDRTFNPVCTILKSKSIPYVQCLGMKDRPKQFKLSQKERLHERDSIYFKEQIDWSNRSILIVDDIMTTGATAHQAAKLFKNKNVRKLNMLTFAR
ncbi:ComF family protein [Staphylococcus sp. 11261D007BR]